MCDAFARVAGKLPSQVLDMPGSNGQHSALLSYKLLDPLVALVLAGSSSGDRDPGQRVRRACKRRHGRGRNDHARKKAQAAYDTAKGELDALRPSRPIAEL